MHRLLTISSLACVYQLSTSCILLAGASIACGPVSNQYSLVLSAKERAHISLVIVYTVLIALSARLHQRQLCWSSAGRVCAPLSLSAHQVRRRTTAAAAGDSSFSPCCLSFIAMFILQSEMNTVHKKGTVGSGPRAGQAPQVAVSPTRSLSTLHRPCSHPRSGKLNLGQRRSVRFITLRVGGRRLRTDEGLPRDDCVLINLMSLSQSLLALNLLARSSGFAPTERERAQWYTRQLHACLRLTTGFCTL